MALVNEAADKRAAHTIYVHRDPCGWVVEIIGWRALAPDFFDDARRAAEFATTLAKALRLNLIWNGSGR